jgi:thiamine-monophosphate kinase
MQEQSIINQLFIGQTLQTDDCFFDGERLYTTDSLCEGTHFLHSWSLPGQIAIKLVEVNVSDILASGGYPESCFLNLGLSKTSSQSEWIRSFIETFQNILKAYSIQLCGGDTYFSQNTNLTLTMISKKLKNPILRSGAQPKDTIYLSGSLGLSHLGYKLLKSQNKPNTSLERQAIQKHLEPRSRIDLYSKLIQYFLIHSMMDITDGLIQDSQKLSHASQKKLTLYIDKIPKWFEYRNFLEKSEIVQSGEELELLFTSPERVPEELATEIGEVGESGEGVIFMESNTVQVFGEIGYSHFTE